ncbi:MAG: PIN domain-containing protein [Treponema sp.]|nr:PIN domain-containing protein [Treponema sp.]
MVLIDTSVIINYLKNVDDQYTNTLTFLIDNKYPIGINNYIYQEILQGAKSEKEYEILKQYLNQFHFYQLSGKSSYEAAAMMNVQCRNSGITIRSTIDLLIAQTAIENDILLLTYDSDFYNMAKVITQLRIFEI